MTPSELKDKVENQDLNRDQLFDIAQKLGLKVDKRKGTAVLTNEIIEKADELEAAFPDADVYSIDESDLPQDDDAKPRTIPEDTSPQGPDAERRRNQTEDASGAEAPEQVGTYTPNIETEAAKESKAEVESEAFQKPKTRVLMNTRNGRRFAYSAVLAARSDMKEI